MDKNGITRRELLRSAARYILLAGTVLVAARSLRVLAGSSECSAGRISPGPGECAGCGIRDRCRIAGRYGDDNG